MLRITISAHYFKSRIIVIISNLFVCRKIKRVFAYCLAFIDNAKTKFRNAQVPTIQLSVTESDTSLHKLIKCAQAEYFYAELHEISFK